jgi:hypothetical protein
VSEWCGLRGGGLSNVVVGAWRKGGGRCGNTPGGEGEGGRELRGAQTRGGGGSSRTGGGVGGACREGREAMWQHPWREVVSVCAVTEGGIHSGLLGCVKSKGKLHLGALSWALL